MKIYIGSRRKNENARLSIYIYRAEGCKKLGANGKVYSDLLLIDRVCRMRQLYIASDKSNG